MALEFHFSGSVRTVSCFYLICFYFFSVFFLSSYSHLLNANFCVLPARTFSKITRHPRGPGADLYYVKSLQKAYIFLPKCDSVEDNLGVFWISNHCDMSIKTSVPNVDRSYSYFLTPLLSQLITVISLLQLAVS